jgi:Rrf2 family nitric oxide-sensitive transcriptional repressor
MRLTSFTDFGLRALMRAAAAPGELVTTDRISAELAISRHHLTKVVRALAAAGFVQTTRGAGGGFTLARPPERITIGEVVRQLEARHALVECFRTDGGACLLTPSCRLKSHLARAEDAFLTELDCVTLADCALGPPSPQPKVRRTQVRYLTAGQQPAVQ